MNRRGIARRTIAAFWCNVVGTLLLGCSVFVHDPLLFMIVVGLGVPLLLAAFLLWLWRVIEQAREKGML